MSNISECCTCGYTWKTGKSGSHSCSHYMGEIIKSLQTQLAAAKGECEEVEDECRHMSIYVDSLEDGKRQLSEANIALGNELEKLRKENELLMKIKSDLSSHRLELELELLKHEWISVSDRVPELDNDENGFVYIYSSDGVHVRSARFNTKTGKFQTHGFDEMKGVKYWMLNIEPSPPIA